MIAEKASMLRIFLTPAIVKFIAKVVTPANSAIVEKEPNPWVPLKLKKFKPQITKLLVQLALELFMRLKKFPPNVAGFINIASNVSIVTNSWIPPTFSMDKMAEFFADHVTNHDSKTSNRKIPNMPRPLSTLLSSLVQSLKTLVQGVTEKFMMLRKWQ